MKYVVLLRGINISGKNKIVMSDLKLLLEKNNYKNVLTYLNSGNVILESNDDEQKIMNDIHKLIKEGFNLEIPVFVIRSEDLADVFKNHPTWWKTGNKDIYDNLIFIIPPTTFTEVYNELGSPKEDLEQIAEYHNSIFWSFDLKNYRKSTWWVKTASTDIKDKITIRNANTIEKLLDLCQK